VISDGACQPGYYNAYPDEIDERIRPNDEEADAAERRWREQSLTR
jgi:hypothetical protein